MYFINTQTGAHTLENVKGNTLQNNNVFTTGGIYGINTTAGVANLRINNNLFVNDSTPSLSSSWYNIYNTGSVGATDSICNNTINMGTFTGVSHSGSVYGIYTASGTLDTITLNNNIFQNQNYLGTTGGTGTTYYLYSASTPGKLNIQGNNYNNMTVKTTGSLYFIYVPGTASLYTTVSNNGITTGYTRVGAGSGTVYFTYCYNSNTAARLARISVIITIASRILTTVRLRVPYTPHMWVALKTVIYIIIPGTTSRQVRARVTSMVYMHTTIVRPSTSITIPGQT